jgi:deoxyribodipyrimidine photo-lyase
MHKEQINIVWFKRDLRLQDHLPLQMAMQSNTPLLLLYFYEPSVMHYPDSDIRHWRFVQESIVDMNNQLKPYNHTIYEIHEEVIQTLLTLQQHYTITQIFSHQETGNAITYERDKGVMQFCNAHQIQWTECATNGIIRGLKHRKDFSKKWLATMHTELYTINIENLRTIHLPKKILTHYTTKHVKENAFQPGGSSYANKYLESFLYTRCVNYSKHISKPELSRTSCSRLSPYLAWGNISMKQVYQASVQAIAQNINKRNIHFFISRLRWHCHFIQKFETQCSIEFENANSGFNQIRTEVNSTYINAWQTGNTGYPLIDACIRCVTQTGYLNFRMRSMLVSFFTHHLWQPWQAGAHFLAAQFLDYEPGIHYPQFQMQAGTVGINTIRIYNPIKQSKEHDPEGVFIKKWIPILQQIPTAHIHEPWLITAAEQLMYNTVIGKDYPAPIINIEETGSYARKALWQTKKSPATKANNEKILQLHTMPRKKLKQKQSTQIEVNFVETQTPDIK